ncbi:MAG: 16S rRNA (cytosine(1402)-N(4))-methyltransferase RsmH [Candidatus Omnitrophica bacterium]|nr:16S rRNA (cytosine(1402)-N(4))-methyltransferase RsmH [Candidatus Omnitrophota bacterium]
MRKEILEYLKIKQGDCILDATIGTGGHAEVILDAVGTKGRLIGIDRDLDSLLFAKNRLSKYSENFSLVHDDFRNLDKVLRDAKIKRVDGILFDLGISSFQLDNPERGFSFRFDSPLDMRMDRSSYISAYDLINYLSEEELSSILKTFGEERWHNRIAHVLVEERHKSPITSTGQLAQLVTKALPYRSQFMKIHPATRTFQAIRIAVNRELESLDEALDRSFEFIKPAGRICVIAFHSLEDRIVKRKFKLLFQEGIVNIITPKPVYPAESEIEDNPRSRSAKLRVAERLQ